MFLAGDGSDIGVRAAFLFRGAGLAGQFQGAVFGPTLTGRPPVRIGIVPAELLQGLALGADVLVVIGVPLEVRPASGAIAAPGLVEDRNVRCDLALDQPAQHRPGAIGRVRDQAFRVQVEPGLLPIQHGLGRADLCLPEPPAAVPSPPILLSVGGIESARNPSINREFFNGMSPKQKWARSSSHRVATSELCAPRDCVSVLPDNPSALLDCFRRSMKIEHRQL